MNSTCFDGIFSFYPYTGSAPLMEKKSVFAQGSRPDNATSNSSSRSSGQLLGAPSSLTQRICCLIVSFLWYGDLLGYVGQHTSLRPGTWSTGVLAARCQSKRSSPVCLVHSPLWCMPTVLLVCSCATTTFTCSKMAPIIQVIVERLWDGTQPKDPYLIRDSADMGSSWTLHYRSVQWCLLCYAKILWLITQKKRSCLRDPEILMGKWISLLFPYRAAQCKLAGKSFRCSSAGSPLSTCLLWKCGSKENAMLANSNFRHASKWQLTTVGDSKRVVFICEYAYSAPVPQLIISKAQWQKELDYTL